MNRWMEEYLKEIISYFGPFLFRRSRADIVLIIVGRLSIFSPALRKFSEKVELTGADEGRSQKL